MQQRKQFHLTLDRRLRPLWLLVILFSLFHGSVAQARKDETQAVKTDLTEGFVLVGDIQVPAPVASLANATYRTRLWTDGDVPFVFDANVNQSRQNAMRAAMDEWEDVAGVHFRPRQDNETNYVHIQNSNGNNSAVGMVGGMQIINIVSWGSKFTIVHELGHCLGLWHEHTRPDRDNFVEIEDQNIQAGKEHNFALNSNANTYGPYDFDSLMHYDKCSFSTDCPDGETCDCASGTETIVVREPYKAQWQDKIGQCTRLSSLDRAAMYALYPVFVDRNYPGAVEKGTFKQPFKSFVAGTDAVSPGGTVIVRPGSYAAAGRYGKPMTIKAPQSGVTLRNQE